MALALCVLLDEAGTSAVRALWEGMAARGISTSMADYGYPPHLTLSVVEDEGLAGVLDAGLPDLARMAELSLTIGPVGRFAGTDVVWLGCSGEGLAELHASATALAPEGAVHKHYRSGAWTPHVTLQTAGHAEEAERYAAEHWPQPVQSWAVGIELVKFPPVATLRRCGL